MPQPKYEAVPLPTYLPAAVEWGQWEPPPPIGAHGPHTCDNCAYQGPAAFCPGRAPSSPNLLPTASGCPHCGLVTVSVRVRRPPHGARETVWTGSPASPPPTDASGAPPTRPPASRPPNFRAANAPALTPISRAPVRGGHTPDEHEDTVQRQATYAAADTGA